jgi:soluble lytic murein transglycosylase-like protein
MFRKVAVVLASTGLVLGSIAVADAGGASTPELAATGLDQSPELAVVDLPAERFQRSIDAHTQLVDYRELLETARRLDAEPAEHALEQVEVSERELSAATGALRQRIEAARDAAAREASAARFASTGVSQATLDAIATCESGGDPTAVNAAGYYGKYQFDLGTWAGVGGSGNPAEASEAEQDYRAGLLYARAGSSPWPVCGI